MTPVLFAGPAHEKPGFRSVGSHAELQSALLQDPSQVVVIPQKWEWLSIPELTEQMLRFPSHWLIGTEGFDAHSLRGFLNTGRVKAVVRHKNEWEEIVERTRAELSQTANEKLKALTQAMIGIQRASSIGEIEMVLNEALNPALRLSWVRIVFAHQTSGIAKSGTVAEFDFYLKQTGMRGSILFGREPSSRFTANEKEFLKEITDTTSLALERLGKLDEAETFKQQWEATFDAISHPLCITSETHTILRTNRAFSRATGRAFRELLGRNAFEAFFPGQKIDTLPLTSGVLLRLSKGEALQRRDFEVVYQSLGFELEGKDAKLLLFRDITEQLRLERRILESSKLAEVGTIASSIAHELNNPLGGMLSFLQLIRMDLKPEDRIYPDVLAMEEATLRCRDIIQNLLGFARLRHRENLEPMDLREAIERAVKLIELQSRSKGIAVEVSRSTEPARINGEVNALSQALCNILQNSIDAVSERRAAEADFNGRIAIELSREHGRFRLSIADNGLGIRPEHESQVFTPLFTTKDSETNAGLGLTIAYSIVRDHSGELEIISQAGSGTTAVITLPELSPSVER